MAHAPAACARAPHTILRSVPERPLRGGSRQRCRPSLRLCLACAAACCCCRCRAADLRFVADRGICIAITQSRSYLYPSRSIAIPIASVIKIRILLRFSLLARHSKLPTRTRLANLCVEGSCPMTHSRKGRKREERLASVRRRGRRQAAGYKSSAQRAPSLTTRTRPCCRSASSSHGDHQVCVW